MTRFVLFLVLATNTLCGHEIFSERIMGLRVNGLAEARLPVAGLSARAITIEFDVNEENPPDLRLRVFHCDRDWNVTPTTFVNDPLRNTIRAPIPYEPAPAGAVHYRFHYTIRIPGFAGIERFPQSGNYLFELLDEEGRNVLARGRFFVVENRVTPAMRVYNRLLPAEVNPFNQVNKIEVPFTLPRVDSLREETFSPLQVRSVDLYRNRQLYDPWRIDPNDRNPNTFVDGYGTARLKFIVDNVPPGNGYRRVDVRSVDDYPARFQPGAGAQALRARLGADVSRFLQRPSGDYQGTSAIAVENRYADYVPFRFELLLDGTKTETVYVVGDFNGWRISPECAMTFDERSGRYVWTTWLRRGAYDYQYVLHPNDWTAIEGNDWRTVNVYTAFIYYHDYRFGGFDRIIGFVQRPGPGGAEPTSH